jgi:hypothetical protein
MLHLKSSAKSDHAAKRSPVQSQIMLHIFQLDFSAGTSSITLAHYFQGKQLFSSSGPLPCQLMTDASSHSSNPPVHIVLLQGPVDGMLGLGGGSSGCAPGNHFTVSTW